MLNHIINKYNWEGALYKKICHGTIELEEEKCMWLNKETAPYLSIEKIVNNPQLISDLSHLVHNCHTGTLENSTAWS